MEQSQIGICVNLLFCCSSSFQSHHKMCKWESKQGPDILPLQQLTFVADMEEAMKWRPFRKRNIPG